MKKTYWGNRDIIGMKFGNFFRKYRLEFIRKRSVLFGVLAMFICFDYFLISKLTDVSQTVYLIGFIASVVTFVIHLILKSKMNFISYIIMVGVYVQYMVFLSRYTFDILNLNRYNVYDIKLIYFMSYDQLFALNFVSWFSLALLLIVLCFVFECIFTKKNENLKRIAEGTVLYISEDKVYGVALDERNSHYDFEISFNKIADVKNIVFEKGYKSVVNLVITDKSGKEYGLSLNDELGAREEIKYIIKEITLGNAPYPKKSCDSCGFYLIDGRCPNCQKPNTLF